MVKLSRIHSPEYFSLSTSLWTAWIETKMIIFKKITLELILDEDIPTQQEVGLKHSEFLNEWRQKAKKAAEHHYWGHLPPID